MTAGKPKTKSDELLGKVNAFVGVTTRYLATDDLNLRRLIRQVEELLGADPAAAHSHLAALYQLTGDVEKTLHHIDNAIRLAPGRLVYLDNKATNLSNLGFFSEAQNCFRLAADPQRGYMTKVWEKGYVHGGFQAMRAHVQTAQRMQIDLTGCEIESAIRAANVLDSAGATDADIGRVLDVLGGVVREHRLFYAGPAPHVVVFDQSGVEPFIEFVFDLDLSPVDAHKIYIEFLDRMLEMQPVAPSVLTVTCRSWGERERSAA